MRVIPGTIGDPAATPEWDVNLPTTGDPETRNGQVTHYGRAAQATEPSPPHLSVEFDAGEVVIVLSLADAERLVDLLDAVEDKSLPERAVAAYVHYAVARAYVG